MRFDMNGSNFFSIRNNFIDIQEVESVLISGKRTENCEFSIMIPTYLRNTYLSETIESVLNQDTNVNYEVVIVDNNPNFEDLSTFDIVHRYQSKRLSYYKNKKNLGMFGNWNRCIELASAPWILILHDDDKIEPNYISTMMKVISKNPQIGCIGCWSYCIDENGDRISKESFKRKIRSAFFSKKICTLTLKDFYFIHPINIMGLTINRDKAIKIGGFDNRWDPTSDYIFILNIADRFPVIFCNEILLNYRVAVNSSLSLKHLIGMVQIDAFMRRNINEYIHILNPQKDRKYRAVCSCNYQDDLLKRMAFRLSKTEHIELLQEYDMLNQSMNFPRLTAAKKKRQRIFETLYGFYIRNIRSFNIKREEYK